MVVKSGILNWERRRLFRAFIRREKKLNPHTQVGVVFSLGMPRQYGGRKFDRDGHEMVLEGPAGDLMDEYNGRSNEVMQKIEEEMRMHDDIVLADYEDTYYNLTWKTVTNLRWISAFCDKRRNDVFVLIDDDHRMNISMLMEFLASVPRGKKRTSIFGRISYDDYANRSPR
ncbi:UDP-GlcNAc:betaGal beta-13-N-acetylglucosaminyltransferase 9, partial [Taenia solium]